MSGFFSPQRMGTLAGVIALVMFVFDVAGYTWFRAQLTPSFALPVWTLFAAYAVLQYFIWRQANRGLDLTDREVAKWGSKLELATPQILDLYAERKPVRDIAQQVQKTHGIPPDITLRYIIALARFRGQSTSDSGTTEA